MLVSLYGREGEEFLAKIAMKLEQALAERRITGFPGQARARALARGSGWTVGDVVCTSGPKDRPFEEGHTGVSIAVVVAGSFQYRAAAQGELMTPGSLLLGNPGQSFECGHEHGEGDRCVSFHYEQGYFEKLAADFRVRSERVPFKPLRLPPLRATSHLVGLACAALEGSPAPSWEELSLQLAATALRLVRNRPQSAREEPPSVIARVTRAVRLVEKQLHGELTLRELAAEAGLSPYHFLRVFTRLTGLTPHQYVRRARLRAVAVDLASQLRHKRVLDLALDTGFGDVSNFNRSFRREFGLSPRKYCALFHQK